MDVADDRKLIQDLIDRGRAEHLGGSEGSQSRFLFSAAVSMSQFIMIPILLFSWNRLIQIAIVGAMFSLLACVAIHGFLRRRKLIVEFREVLASQNPYRILLVRKGVPWTELASPLEEDLVSAVRSAKESEVKIDDETELYLVKRLGTVDEWVYWRPARFGAKTEEEILRLLSLRPVSAMARFELIRREPSLRKFSEYAAVMGAR